MSNITLLPRPSSENELTRFQKLKIWAQDVKQRIDDAPKWDFALDTFNLISTLYTILFTLTFSLSKAAGVVLEMKWFIPFVVTSAYISIYRYLPKSKKMKWAFEETNRIKMLSIAEGEIATLINSGYIDGTILQRIIESILRAIKSEVETIVSEEEPTNINVALLVHDKADSTKLEVIAHAVSNRKFIKIDKNEAVAWEAMSRRRSAYEPDYSLDSRAPYKTIYAFPVVLEPTVSNVGEMCLAGVTIDSARKDHFGRFKQKIEIRMLPYLNLLSIALVLKISEHKGS